MSIQTALRTVARHLADLALPQDCLLCQASSGDGLLCARCQADLPRLPESGCRVCALPIPGGDTCGACLASPPAFDATVAAFAYGFPLDTLVQGLKYRHRLAIADFLGRELAVLPATPVPDLLLPVPLSAERLRQRGFNQSLELARPLAKRIGLAADTASVIRCRDTAPQASLPWKERHRNIRHAFHCTADLTGKIVWVIDDVMTTGATLGELAAELKAHGAARVENRVVARAVRE